MTPNKKKQIFTVLLMISIVLLWVLMLYYYLTLDNTENKMVISTLLLIIPALIMLLDKPTIVGELIGALTETISLAVWLVIEKIAEYFEVRKYPKQQRKYLKHKKMKKNNHKNYY